MPKKLWCTNQLVDPDKTAWIPELKEQAKKKIGTENKKEVDQLKI